MKKAKTWSTITLAMIPICLAINYVGAQIAIALKLPMYLDVIGTVMMGAICGPIPGVVLGALSSVINSLSEPTAIAYIPATVAYGLVAGLLGKGDGGPSLSFFHVSLSFDFVSDLENVLDGATKIRH